MYLSKLVLVLMLMATQLLAGSGGSFYLCIGEGLLCCIDTGPAACTCCHDPQGPPADKCCSRGDCHPQQCDQVQLPIADDDCSCLHIPVVIPPLEPTTLSHGSSAPAFDFVIASNAASEFCAAPVRNNVWPVLISTCSDPPRPDAYALAMLATIVIRC